MESLFGVGSLFVVDGMLQHNGRKLFLCIIEGGSPGLYLLITASTLQHTHTHTHRLKGEMAVDWGMEVLALRMTQKWHF